MTELTREYLRAEIDERGLLLKPQWFFVQTGGLKQE